MKGTFDYSKVKFDLMSSDLIFYGQTLDKIVWQYPKLDYISTTKNYSSTISSLFIKSNLVNDGVLSMCTVPLNEESINIDLKIVQWKKFTSGENLDIVWFRITTASGDLVPYLSGNIFSLCNLDL